jgi:hypothetical protein
MVAVKSDFVDPSGMAEAASEGTPDAFIDSGFS